MAADGVSTLRGIVQNRNVFLTIVFGFLDGACFSVWNAQLLPILIGRLGGDTAVGWSALACGVARIASAVVAGHVGDKLARKVVIRVGAFCGFVAAGATLAAVNFLHLPAMYAAQALWGVYMGVVSTSVEALFADSVLSGHRAFIYNLKWILQTVCYCVGYVVGLWMLFMMGNVWTMESIQLVMTVGLMVHPLAHLLLFLLRDEDALSQHDVVFTVLSAEGRQTGGQETSHEHEQEREALVSVDERDPFLPAHDKGGEKGMYSELPTSACACRLYDAESLESDKGLLRERNGNLGGAEEESLINRETDSASAHFDTCHLSSLCFRLDAVPYVICFAELWMAVGSGMTVQYLTLFLVNDFAVSPTWLMATYIMISCGTALCSTALRYVGEHFIGRLPAVIMVRLFGTAFLLVLALIKRSFLRLTIVVIVFILRGSFMNSPVGITRSVLMDCVPKSTRARWSAFENVSSFLWAGSALVGGYIAEARGYQFAFLVTAVLHAVGVLSLVPAAVAMHKVEQRLRAMRQLERES